MPGHGRLPTLLCLLPLWSVLMLLSCHPQHSPCQLIQKTAVCTQAKVFSVPAGLPDTIDELQLNYNHIHTLPSDSLLHYPSLSTLGLAGNDLETIASDAFQASQQLESLNLAENCLNVGYQETSRALLKLPRLRILDLSDNGLDEDMAPILLQNLTSLEYLNLSRNLLQRLDESSFRNLHHLKELDLQSNLLYELDDAFSSTPKLQRLNLAFNHLACLYDFHMTQLVVLNVSHNAIEWFAAAQHLQDTFHLETLDLSDNNLLFFPFLPSQSRLRNLYLSRNKVSFYEHLADDTPENQTASIEFLNLPGNASNVTVALWDEGLHGDISSLELLDLSENRVTYFPQGFFHKMPVLSTLRMFTNCLETLNFTSERFPGSLYELDVSRNRVKEVVADHQALRLHGNLTYLNLSQNNIQKLPSEMFPSLPSLRVADLSYNRIAICSADIAEDHRGSVSDCVVWRHVVSLTQLYLKGCQLGRVPVAAFEGTSLTHLELSDNAGLRIGPGSIQSLSRTLQYLGLGHTGIQTFDFTPFQSLKSLNISGNSLSLPPPFLPTLNLQILDLRDNRLSTIPLGQAHMLARKLQRVYLSGNPFNCCQLEWYRRFEQTKAINMIDRSDISCRDLNERNHRVEFTPSHVCLDKDGESIFWYFMLIVPICLVVVGISIVSLLTLRPKLLPKAIKKKCWKPTPY